MNQVVSHDEFIKAQQALQEKFTPFLKQISGRENFANLMRCVLPPILLIIAIGAFAPALKFLNISDDIYAIITTTAAIIAWVFAIYLLFRNLKNRQKPSNTKIEHLFETHYNLTETSPLSLAGDKPSINDNQSLNLWLHQIKSFDDLKIKRKRYFPQINLLDKLFLAGLVIAIALFAADYKNATQSIKPDFAAYFGGAPDNISAWIISDNKDAPIIPLDEKTHEIAKGTRIAIEVNGAKFTPKARLGNIHSKLKQTSEGNYTTEIVANKSGVLKLEYFGTKAKWPLKIIIPPRPKFIGAISFTNVGTNAISAHFNLKDKNSVDKMQLVLKGKIDGRKFISTIPVKTDDIQSGVNDIIIETAKSALVDNDVYAWLEIANTEGKTGRSNSTLLYIPTPEYTNPFSAALGEIRLLILRETNQYKREPRDIAPFLFGNNQTQIDITDNIQNAPPNIQKAYALLNQIFESKNLNVDSNQIAAIKYALSTLEGSRTTTEAKQISDILWQLIDINNNKNMDTRAKVSQAIERLKQAIQNGASDDEIIQLKEELNQAIAEHIQSLAENSQDAGDMEVEDKTNLSNQNIQELMNNIENNAKNGNPDDALSQLDELDTLMQNLDVINQQAGEGGENSLTDIINKQRELNEQTAKPDGDNHDNAKQQEELKQRLQTMPNNSPELNQALQNMQSAEDALKNGDKAAATKAQEDALRNLIQSANRDQNQSNTDPLGRETPIDNAKPDDKNNKTTNGNGKGTNTKLPTTPDKNRVRDIIRSLREKLSDPNQDAEEQEYYQDLLNKNK